MNLGDDLGYSLEQVGESLGRGRMGWGGDTGGGGCTGGGVEVGGGDCAGEGRGEIFALEIYGDGLPF